MTTNFPAGLDAFTNPSATDAMDSATVPHAAQHANLNDAVEALQAKVGVDGSAVTTSLDYKVAQQGLTFIKSVNIGSAVTSVTVTDAFNSSYENYRVLVNITSASTAMGVQMRLGSTTTNYFSVKNGWRFDSGTPDFISRLNGGYSFWDVSAGGATGGSAASIDVFSPYETARTRFTANGLYGHSTYGAMIVSAGYQDSNTSFTSFQIFPSTGNMTGGSISVYGYNNG